MNINCTVNKPKSDFNLSNILGNELNINKGSNFNLNIKQSDLFR